MKPFSDAWNLPIRGTPLLIAYLSACGLAFLLFGYDQGVMGGLVNSPYFLEVFPSLASNPTLLGTTVAIYEVGALIGSLACWIFGNHFGRRVTLMSGALIVLIGAALQAAAVNLTMLIVFRVFAGFGIGVLTSVTPPFVAECFPTRLRGRLVSCELLIGSTGLCSSFWVGYGCSFVPGQFAWRFPVALQCIFPMISIVMLCFLPDSPRWYVEQGRVDEARDLLVRLNGAKEGESVLQDIQEALLLEGGAQDNKSWLDCFTDNNQCFRYRTLLSIGALFMQQCTGVNMISYYSAVLFQNSIGLSANLSLLLSGFNGGFSTLFLIDRVGRVRLMMWTAATQAAQMAVLAAVLHYTEESRSYGIVGASMLFFFFATFSIGWLAPSWLYPSEITPLAIRASAAALGSASNWIFNFVVVEITPSGIANIGPNYYIIYAITNAICVPMLYFLYPETANLSLEEVDSLFVGGKVHLRRSPRETVAHAGPITKRAIVGEMRTDVGEKQFTA
ncbi:general substrate transporter [Calocera cornea HHB12733]|uniref:General substrate transporter n=1 Tax=Calocera cornea HHB12733 TaxID=1353952 RepID=A0A165HPS9_9BASI|nr:general substrate transporter [Calocera cornea HHB12733]